MAVEMLQVSTAPLKKPSPGDIDDPLGERDCVEVKPKKSEIQSNIVYEVCGLDGVPVTDSNGNSVVTQLSPEAREKLGLEKKPDQPKGPDAKVSSG